MAEKILLVDDEPSVLEAYERLLHKDFQIVSASSPAVALEKVREEGPFAVVISDMHMPEMDGIQLLVKIKGLSPYTTRIMLTGNTDIDVAMHAVNDGNIFRFLSKPCDKEILSKTLVAALNQHRLVTTEQELLEETLRGSIRVLTEVLSAVDPISFGRAMRVHRYIEHIASKLAMSDSWRLEIAAMMSQLGCVTLDNETIEAIHAGREITPEQQARFDAHPSIAHDLLSKIPRMEPVAWMIAHQNDSAPVMEDNSDRELAETTQAGARILGAASAFDRYLQRGFSKADAAKEIRTRYSDLDPKIADYLTEVDADKFMITRTCAIEDLSAGMVLQQEVRTNTGMLLVSKGQEVTIQIIFKLKEVLEKGDIASGVLAAIPRSEAAKTVPPAAK
jgi:FixJ family two-component response regulator